MQARHISSEAIREKNIVHGNGVVNGFQYYQSSACGYNSCTCTSSHYHCQTCGYGTSEFSLAGVHKESCARIVRGRFSQSPCVPAIGNSQIPEHPLSCSAYDPGSESTMASMPMNSVQSSMQMANSGNHLYYRGSMTGSQQSSVFNPLLSSQSQPLYSGVFGSQVGFSNQNNYPPAFNGYGHVEPPPWLSDTRISSSNNSTPNLETGRNSKSLSCNSQGMSHSCYSGRVGILENISLCSPLSTETYKSLSKETSSCQHKSAITMESQNWFCGQSMLGYTSQVSSQGLQNSMYKCTEPFSSCTMSQLGIPLNDQGELKHANICFDTNQISKQSTSYHSSSRKTSCLEMSKNPTKYCSQSRSQIDHNAPCMQQKDHDNSVYESPSMMFGNTDSDLNEDIYSQTTAVLQGSEERTSNPYAHSNKTSTFYQSIAENTKGFTTQQCQALSGITRCSLSSCEVLEGCQQLEGQPLYQYPQIHPPVPPIDEDRLSNTGSCSGAAESDIVVEESEEEEEVIESEVSVEDTKSTSSTRCLVCSSSDACFVSVSIASPVTSTTHVPIATILTQVVSCDNPPLLSFHNELICRRCLNLINTVDSLENKLASAKKNLIELYKGRELPQKTCEKQEPLTKLPLTMSSSSSSSSCTPSPLPPPSPSHQHSCPSRPPSPQPSPPPPLPQSPLSPPLQNIQEDKSEENVPDSQAASVDSSEHKNRLPNEDFPLVDTEDDISNIADSIDEQKENKEDEEKNGNEYKTESDVSPGCDDMECSEGKFLCNICKKPLASKENLNKHLQIHTKTFSFYCDRCGQGFMIRSSLENHLLIHSRDYRYQCEVCGKCFIQRHALDDHLRKHQGKYRLKCDHCGKGFMYASSLAVHKRTHTGERPFVCEHCGKSFVSASNLTAHVHLCSGELLFSCSNCDRKFASPLQLKAHMTTSHENNPRHKCDTCGKVFAKPYDLKVHIRCHSGEKPHRCSVCGKCYSSISNLNQHKKQHHEDRPFKCTLCGEGFLRKSFLERHKNQHDGLRPFKCKHCEKGFASAHDLHSHSKLHTGNMKKYTCPVCGKILNHGLKVHMRIHTGDKPYTCSECKVSFTVKSTLDKHIRLKHQHIT